MSFFYYVIPTVLVLALLRKWREYIWGYCKNKVSLHGKVVLITGANSGIGLEISKELAKRGAKVILACRDIRNANSAIIQILSELSSDQATATTLIPMQLDLASLGSVTKFVDEFNKTESKIDILINNAGVFYPKKVIKQTEDGFEIHFGINHLGHFLLTKLLLPNLKSAAPSRIIIVSSTLHQRGNIYLDDLNLLDRMNKSGQYENSKLANAYFCRELAERVKEDGINVYALCPGWVYTGLFRNYKVKWYHKIFMSPVAFWFMRTPRQGAQTIVYCATEPSLDKETGMFYRDCKNFKSSVKFDSEIQKKLWECSEQMIEYAKL